MRIAADPRHLEVEPGDTTAVSVEVVNTDDVIDGITAHVIGFPDHCVTSHPALLPLFPDTGGRVNLDLAVPRTHPAGRHPLTVEVVSHGTGNPPGYVDVDLDVAARPGLRLEPRPRLIRSRRTGRFVLELTNNGNVALDVVLAAQDPDRAVRTTFSPARRRVYPGTVSPVLLAVRGPRMITGADVDRTVVVSAEAEPLGVAPDGADETDTTTLVRQASVVLRQRPLVGRGLLTVLILLTIVATWAAIFLFGLAKVFGQDPMTKEAPASFFASLNQPVGAGSGAAGAAGFAAGSAGPGGIVPAGALSKTGQLPPGMGGQINGLVSSATDGQPVGRILVQAYRMSRTGLRQMSSAASQADGTYSLAGLFPTAYYIKFSATGYRDQWYPNRPTSSGASPVTAVAQGFTSNIDAAVVGLPASISGQVNAGNTLKPVTTTVTARPLRGPRTGQVVATATTTAAGAYALRRLPAPGSYQLTFTTPGYQASSLVDSVSGGDARLEPTVFIDASSGEISGVVSAGGAPLGGATVTTTVRGVAVRINTPTTGQVGAYILDNLPTPGTYVVTVSAPGHGSATQIVDLAAGQSRSGLNLTLSSASGSITGQVVGPDGRGLGGATVTVGGTMTAGPAATTTTLTAGSPGTFVIDGLGASGSYTLTATLTGYISASVPVTLTGTGFATGVTIRLASQFGGVSGVVTDAAGRPVTAVVTATNGTISRTTTPNSADGAYLITGLEPGSYSVTATSPGLRQQTALVVVVAGNTVRSNLRLVP